LVLSGCGYPTEGGLMAAAATARAPAGTVQVVDPHPLNWLFITWNTMEEPVRTDQRGHIVGAAMEDSRWIDETTLEVQLRKGVRYQDGEELSAESFRRAFEEVQRWKAPHPPGTYLNFHPDTRLEVVDAHTVRMRFPQPDGLVLGKFCGFHIPSTRFWEQEGFGYRKRGTGEGHW
jgi:ABC-type transport system substrate-binding protein